ncbi:msr8120 [Mesorhizobium japonicum MAFF 303099]|uniref:Msr8120 protein n=1 Tax=Mesorhizobium japonicum (strain LMG 29417 / CECT 9101 / MAFF 303099) TaxID=266835 RepID=Q983X7_RHILO|nr:msr8120 [Mesorhizobium japonicum MAFF 303099]
MTGGNLTLAGALHRMLKKIALAAVLFQVAVFSALITQTVLFASTATQAADVQPSEPVAVTDKECAAATWPNIPGRCLERVEARNSTVTMVLSVGQ